MCLFRHPFCENSSTALITCVNCSVSKTIFKVKTILTPITRIQNIFNAS